MEEMRSKAKISQIFYKERSFLENSPPDPGLCSHSKLRRTEGHPGIFTPNNSPWENALSKLPKLFQISGKLPSPGIDAKATEIVGFALQDEIPAAELSHPKNCPTHP